MAEVIVTLKIMPSSPDADLVRIEAESKKIIEKFGGEIGKKEIEPIAFGLNALKLIIIYDEKKGSTDALEASISEVDDVNSVEVTDCRRAIG